MYTKFQAIKKSIEDESIVFLYSFHLFIDSFSRKSKNWIHLM